MPTYLCHGFRWHRPGLRVFAQFQDIDDMSPDWVCRKGSAHAVIYTLYELFDFLPLVQDFENITPSSPTVPIPAAAPIPTTDLESPQPDEKKDKEKEKEEASKERKLLRKRSRARLLQKLGLSSSSSSSPPVPPLPTSPVPSTSPNSPIPPSPIPDATTVEPTVYMPPANDPRPSTPPQHPNPPIIPRLYLPPQSQTIILPPGVPAPSMPPRHPFSSARLSRITRSDDSDPVLENNTWASLSLLEEYDPVPLAADTTGLTSRPWAYVADYAVRIDLGAPIMAEMENWTAWQKTLPPTLRSMTDAIPEDEPGYAIGKLMRLLAMRDAAANPEGQAPSAPAPVEQLAPEGKKEKKDKRPISARPPTAAPAAPPVAPEEPQRGWFQLLRDEVQPDEGIKWYVVVCHADERDDLGAETDSAIGSTSDLDEDLQPTTNDSSLIHTDSPK